ncbi:MAG: hypothetical protein HY881_26595 [Deltaproteobacteria bacterium]|nr:hypothetical protein [Deltaproteobacteria bacterium]
MSKNPHTGSSFDDFLKEEGLQEECTAVALKRVLAWQLKQEMKMWHRLKNVCLWLFFIKVGAIGKQCCIGCKSRRFLRECNFLLHVIISECGYKHAFEMAEQVHGYGSPEKAAAQLAAANQGRRI